MHALAYRRCGAGKRTPAAEPHSLGPTPRAPPESHVMSQIAATAFAAFLLTAPVSSALPTPAPTRRPTPTAPSGQKWVWYEGQRMVEGWPEKIRAAQRMPTYRINDRTYRRVPYGSETPPWSPPSGPCHDCGVLKGQLHVSSCDVEQCPRCRRQVLTCSCKYQSGWPAERTP